MIIELIKGLISLMKIFNIIKKEKSYPTANAILGAEVGMFRA